MNEQIDHGHTYDTSKVELFPALGTLESRQITGRSVQDKETNHSLLNSFKEFVHIRSQENDAVHDGTVLFWGNRENISGFLL